MDPYYGRGVLDAAAAVTAADASPAAPAVPFDRAPADAGRFRRHPGDSAGAARAAEPPGTFSPEGDVDWYRFDVASAGWYDVQVGSPR